MIPSDEGVVKYRCEWDAAPAEAGSIVDELGAWRNRLYERGLIGVYEDGVGFGNVSARAAGNEFLITGTQTGHVALLGPEHITRVVECSIAGDWLRCVGPVAASSEALTHAALYELGSEVGAVVHVHHRRMWDFYRGRLPTTRAEVPYGSVEMAQEMARLWSAGDLRVERSLVMAGHADGLIAFGVNVGAAAERIIELHEALFEGR